MRDSIFEDNKKKKTQALCILVAHGLRKEIMEKLDTTYPTVKCALNYEVNTSLAVRIRHYALTHGGVLAEKKTL